MPRENVAASGKALVLDNAPVNVLDQRLRIAVMQTLPMLQVSIPGAFVQYESPLWAWLIGAIVLAMIVLTIGCLISLVDRFLATQGHRRHLLNLGVSPRRLTTLEAWLFAVPYTTIFAISFGIGVALCALIVYPNDVEMPWGAIIGTFVVAAVTGLLGTAGVALFSARSIRKNPEELRGEVAQR